MQTDDLWRRVGATVRWVVVVSALALTWGGAIDRVRAQADDGLIYSQRTEVLFPAVIRFFVGVMAERDAIESVSLSVSQETGLDETFSFAPEQHLYADFGSSVELVYDWLLTGDGPTPMPFAPVEYAWSIQLTNGQTLEAGSRFVFEDASVGAWERAEDGPIVLYWHNVRLAGRGLQKDVMRAHTLLSDHLERPIELAVAIYDPGVDFCQRVRRDDGTSALARVSSQDGREYPCSEQLYVAVYAANDITLLKRSQWGYSEVQDAIISLMVRQTYGSLWRNKAVPAWFETGLAGMYHLLPNHYALEVTRAAGRTESLYSLDDLTFYPPDDLSIMDQALWDAESYLLVLYLADQFGAQAPFDLARRVISDPGNFDTVFAQFTGRELRVFWAEWERWLFDGAAVDAARWTPYLQTTPTPTPTPTPTVLLPTPIKTQVPTYTPTGAFVPADAVTPTPVP